jgi:hypothetical protein
MAGIAVEQDSIHINLQNASFANLKFTTFALEVLIILLHKSDLRAKMQEEQC